MSRVGLLLCVGCSVLIGMLFLFGLGAFARLVSHDPEVHEQMDKLRWIAGAANMALGGFFPLVAVLNKQGRAGTAGLIIPICCWGAGFPASYFLSRTEGVRGIWYGLVLGYSFALLALAFCYCRSDWPELSKEARRRAELTPQQSDSRELRSDLLAADQLGDQIAMGDRSPHANGSNGAKAV